MVGKITENQTEAMTCASGTITLFPNQPTRFDNVS